MKNSIKITLTLAIASLFFAVACEDDTNNTNDANGSHELKLKTSISYIGNYPNRLAQDENYVYIVDSGNNAINRLHKTTHELTRAFVDLGQNASPFAIYLDNDDIYIVNGVSQTVVKTTKSNPKQLVTIASAEDDLINPSDVIVKDGFVIIADSEYVFDATPGQGKLLVVTPDNTKHKIQTTNQNPLKIDYIDKTTHGTDDNYFVVTTSGVVLFKEDGTSTPPEKSCAEFIKVSQIQQESPVIEAVCVENNSIGLSTFLKGYMFFGTGTNDEIHTLNLATRQFEPKIKLDNNATMLIPESLDSRYIAVGDLANDTIAVLDSKAPDTKKMLDEALKLTSSAAEKKGVIHLSYDASTHQLFVLNSYSNSIDIVEVNLPKE